MTQAQTLTPLAVDRDEGEAIWWFGSLAVTWSGSWASRRGAGPSRLSLTRSPTWRGSRRSQRSTAASSWEARASLSPAFGAGQSRRCWRGG